MAPRNAHMYSKIILYTQYTPTCFVQLCGHHQGYKIERLDTLKV